MFRLFGDFAFTFGSKMHILGLYHFSQEQVNNGKYITALRRSL